MRHPTFRRTAVLLGGICLLLHTARAGAQTMDQLFLESTVVGGVNATYSLDDAQLARMTRIIDTINARAGAQLAASRSVILCYVELWNLEGAAGLIGSGRAQYISFLEVATRPDGAFEIIVLHAITDSPELVAYFENRGLGDEISLVEDMDAKWVMETDHHQETRSVKLTAEGPALGQIKLALDDLPLVTTNGPGTLNGINFLARPAAVPAGSPGYAWGLENSGEQFVADLATSDFEATFRHFDLPFKVGSLSANLNEFFPGNAGLTRLRTESRFWRWWVQ